MMPPSARIIERSQFYEAHVGSVKTPAEIMVQPDGTLLPPE